jgi:hypothetical protein
MPTRRAPIRVRAFVAPGAEATLTMLQQDRRLKVDVVGHLVDPVDGVQVGLPALMEQVTTAKATGNGDQILLVLGANGGLLFRFRS